ncbi:MAG: hypothetical protein J7K31_01420 [Candidatus Aenigmarchaeota archaeon]|nr:hypothetical protein [Candidatus Aenigmarchaeota archaeon]
MNNKIILPLVLVVLIVGIVGIYFWKTPTQPTTPPNLQNIILLPSVKGCAETDKGMATKAFGEGTEQEPKIEVSGNEIIYSRAINHLCCRKAEIEKETKDSVINIYEVWSGIGCKCICFSEIEAKLQNVPLGTYVVNVYEKGTQPGNEGPMEQKLIISQNVVVQ